MAYEHLRAPVRKTPGRRSLFPPPLCFIILYKTLCNWTYIPHLLPAYPQTQTTLSPPHVIPGPRLNRSYLQLPFPLYPIAVMNIDRRWNLQPEEWLRKNRIPWFLAIHLKDYVMNNASS